jgi:hypothetical protein
MQAHRRIPRHHEIERGAGRPAIKKWCSEPAGRNSLVADKCDAHETARGVGLKLEQRANFFRAQIIGHSSLNSKNRTGVIDVIAHDPKTGEAVLVMNEPNEWDSSDEQLLSLQERFNAYVSFLLDGEMESGHPELAGKPARIEVRCAHMPDSRVLELLGLIHDQLAFQEIKMELVILNDETRISNDEGMTKSE